MVASFQLPIGRNPTFWVKTDKCVTNDIRLLINKQKLK